MGALQPLWNLALLELARLGVHGRRIEPETNMQRDEISVAGSRTHSNRSNNSTSVNLHPELAPNVTIPHIIMHSVEMSQMPINHH